MAELMAEDGVMDGCTEPGPCPRRPVCPSPLGVQILPSEGEVDYQ